MWLFLATEVLLFGGLFCAYSVYRHNHPELFAYSSHFLNTTLGATNTCVLILSSLTMAWGVTAAQQNKQGLLKLMLFLTLCGAAGFLVIKYFEYTHKFHHHHFPSTDSFYGSYFTLTGLHGVHVLLGILTNLYFLFPGSALWKKDPDQFMGRVENAGLYWHFVDLVWIFLFPTLYLL